MAETLHQYCWNTDQLCSGRRWGKAPTRSVSGDCTKTLPQAEALSPLPWTYFFPQNPNLSFFLWGSLCPFHAQVKAPLKYPTSTPKMALLVRKFCIGPTLGSPIHLSLKVARPRKRTAWSPYDLIFILQTALRFCFHVKIFLLLSGLLAFRNKNSDFFICADSSMVFAKSKC